MESERKFKISFNNAMLVDLDEGIEQFIEFRQNDLSDEKVISCLGQDTVPILTDNYKERLHSDEGWKKGKNLKRVGSIPLVVWLEWERLGITRDSKALLKMLDRHPEYKTTTRRLS